MSTETESLPVARIQEVAATLMLRAARKVLLHEQRSALVDLGLENNPQAVAMLRRVIREAHLGVEVPGNPMAFFDDPALPEEVRYQ